MREVENQYTHPPQDVATLLIVRQNTIHRILTTICICISLVRTCISNQNNTNYLSVEREHIEPSNYIRMTYALSMTTVYTRMMQIVYIYWKVNIKNFYIISEWEKWPLIDRHRWTYIKSEWQKFTYQWYGDTGTFILNQNRIPRSFIWGI
jgi:hypothetical protein